MKPEHTKQIQKLITLGLTEREAKVYITLLSKKGFTTLELQNSVDIPRTKIYEVLQRMLARGICTERGIGRIKYYEAVEPKIAFHRLYDECKEFYDSDMVKRKSVIKDLTGFFNPVFEKNKDLAYTLDFVEVFRDKEQIQKKYIQSVKDTKKSLLTFNKGPYVCDTSGRLNEQVREETKLLKRGVLCKNIFEERELMQHDWLVKYVRSQAKFGQQSRATDSLPIKMMVFDEKKVFFPLLQTSGEMNTITMIFIEHRELAKACRMLFNFIWESGRPV
jgi:HTH-type transcriptional regulator, sugar sensing transcriptional regulator